MGISLEEFVERYLGRKLKDWEKFATECISEGKQFAIAMPRKSGVTLFRKAIAEVKKRQKADNMGLSCVRR